MQGTQLGPYHLLSELGSGGMGTVHAAEITADVPGLDFGSRVAIKVIHPHLLSSPGFFKRFLREGELGRKVVHENVVRTFDVDATELEGKVVHYMVMEYVEGKSLRQLLDDLRTIPETLLREIALQTAAGLAAIHAHGIVHRDLKPENVLITDDQEIRVMDLGVAKLQETSIAITQEGHFAGSILYAAPEQFGPDGIGPLVDLYALGVMLHELSTGDNPFRRDDAAGVIDAHLKLQPRRLTDVNQETTAFLAELVATLLAKSPEERFASAEALHDVLVEAERSSWWRALEPKLREEVAHLPKIRVRRETEPHGMDADLEVLREAWVDAKAGEGNTIFIEGEAGIGKTRLLDAFLHGLGEKDIHVLYGSYPPSGGLGGVSDAILQKFGEATLARGLRPYLTVTPSLVPAFAALMKRESPPAGSEPLQGDALHAVCVHLMRALAEERPLIWLIEDLHFAPRGSRDSVLALARAVAGHRVLLVLTARPGVPDDELANFSRLENHQRVSLRRLGAREVVELLEEAFKSEALAEKLGIRIAKKSDGVPFFIFEMIRGLKEGQFIKQQPDGTYVQTQMITDIEVPSKVKDLIEGRLGGLSEEQRAVLDVGAVEGLVFDPGLVATVLDEKRVRVLRHLAEIQRRSGLVADEGELARFDQNQIQEVLYLDLPTHLRAEYHTLLAEAHAARLTGEPTGEDAFFLAAHHLRGSRPQAGSPHLIPALEHLEKCYRNEFAIELADRALRTPGLLEGPARAEILLRKGGLHDLNAEREPERVALEEAAALADAAGEPGLRARACHAVGWYLAQVADYEAAQDHLHQALDLARAAGDKANEALATGTLGGVLHNLARYEAARAQPERRLDLAREIGDRQGEARATGSLGTVFWSQGRLDEARRHYETWLALTREIGDRRGESGATGGLGNVFFSLGRYEEARVHYERWLDLAREIGDRPAADRATGNLGLVFQAEGRSADARATFEKRLALAREIGDRLGESRAAVNLALVLALLGRYTEARKLHENCLVLAREIGDQRQEGKTLASLAELADAEGDTEAALRLGQQALALRRDLGEKATVADSLVALGEIERKRGDLESAVAHLDEALALAWEVQAPTTIVLAAVHRARLPGGDPKAALAAFEEHAERIGHGARMEARFFLWELTQDNAHLTDAHGLLMHTRDHAPDDCRETMIENVPLHKDIMKAWKEHGHAD